VESGKHEHWRSRLGVIFATSGSAIGLGTLWKLPYMVGQGGGGAFILLFLLFTLLIGTPLFIAELALGKHFQKNVVDAFKSVSSPNSVMPLFGWLAIIATLLIAGWYGVVSGWGINYLIMALADAFANRSPNDFHLVFMNFRSSGGLNVLWQAVFVLITCLILAKGVRQGIERFSKLFFSLLFILVIGLFIYASTLDGFQKALDYILYPDFSKIDRATLIAAIGLSLFVLSLGQGIMVTYGSYLKKEQSIVKTAFIVSLSVVAISVLVSLMIFPMVFHFGFPPESGEGLLFVTMPYVTEQLPGSMALSALFFILLIFAALTSYIGQLEVLVAAFMEHFHLSRLKAVVIAGLSCFIVGLPTALMRSKHNPYPAFETIFHKSFLDVNNVIIDWMLILFSLGICIAVGYKIERKALANTLDLAENSALFILLLFAIRVLVPLCLLLAILSRFGFLQI
jgi:NSS family neurotransmitter:Na+ symporter